ncbi:T9SS type A sorting domain-containing protein [Psychroserpens mesophilus]|uniref:T9SS type A sorting domain-containing protein n=1 Tax=Psychroserpens mesophilus TaxID=325473 RepID=UPI003D65714B
MKTLLFIFILFLTTTSAFSQCSINPYIQANYELDAKLLAMRAISNNPQDPDFNNPFLPDSRVEPYLEKLSAIYENPINSPIIDEIFNDFEIHVNQEYNYSIDYKRIVLVVSTSLPWLDSLLNTGISGIDELDNLISTYQLSLVDYNQLNSCSCTHLYLETNFDFLNMYALIDDFENIDDIDYAEVFLSNLSLRFNYTGIPYILYDDWDPNWSENVEVCDIFINEEDEFVFGLYGGDCMAGCVLSEFRYVTVTNDCEVLEARLSIDTAEKHKFKIYPNPAENQVFIESESLNEIIINIYNLIGENVLSRPLKNNFVNVSSLNSGVYMLNIEQDNRTVTKKLIIR